MRKRIVTVTRGALSGTGANKTFAKADLEKQIDWACASHYPHLETRFGYLIAIVPTTHGWQSTVICPQRLGEHGRIHESSTMIGPSELAPLIQSARLHAAQSAWNPDCDDAAHVAAAGLDNPRATSATAADLARWIRFQRAYIANIATGMTPAEAHASACRVE